jgi:ferritin-like metal-binding protein YciE
MLQLPFYILFLDFLREVFDGETQMIQFLPNMIRSSSHQQLQEALSEILDDSKNRLERLKHIFKVLNTFPTKVKSTGLRSVAAQCEETIKNAKSSSVKDAGIIIFCQKICHLQIASYGSLRAIALHLSDAEGCPNFDFEAIADELQVSLNEYGDADDLLSTIAEGSFFTQGINEEAEREKPDHYVQPH